MGTHCLNTMDKVKIILAKMPLRLSVQELGDISGFHRNTLRNVLNRLTEQQAVKATSDARTRNYFSNDLLGFYQRIAVALPSKAVAQKVGYRFVQDILKETIGEKDTTSAQNNPEEFEEFLSFSFPFFEYQYSPNGTIVPVTSLEIAPVNENDNFTTYTATVSPCLCKGQEHSGKSCAMVQGSLKASTEYVYKSKAIVSWTEHGQIHGLPSCTFSIRIPKNPDPELNSIRNQPELNIDEF